MQYSKLFLNEQPNKFNQINFDQLSELPVDQNHIISDNQYKTYQQFQSKTVQNNNHDTTKSTKSVKGRPKKREKYFKTTSKQAETYFSQHQKTIFSLVLSYTYKSLQKHQKFRKSGFLHQKIVPQDDFYVDFNEALQNNNLLQQQKNYTNLLKNQISKSNSLENFIKKVLWIGPTKIMDEIIYLMNHILWRYVNNKVKTSEDQNKILQIVMNFGEQFSKNEYYFFWNKFKFLNFKNPKMKIDDNQYQHISKEFNEFVKVFTVSTILAKQDFIHNPFFTQYYTIQIDQTLQKKSNTKKRKSSNNIKETIQEEQQIQELSKPTKMIKKNQDVLQKYDLKDELSQEDIYFGDSYN